MHRAVAALDQGEVALYLAIVHCRSASIGRAACAGFATTRLAPVASAALSIASATLFVVRIQIPFR
jgi:hypothetical protein